jgi:hypothetical protein
MKPTTSDEFNKKWGAFLKKGHYGLALDKPEVIEYLDAEFESLSKLPDFKFSQIKSKFNSFRFYADGVPSEKCYEIERKLAEIYKE